MTWVLRTNNKTVLFLEIPYFKEFFFCCECFVLAKQERCLNMRSQKYVLYQKLVDPKISKRSVAVTVIDAVPWKHFSQCQGSILSHTCLSLHSDSFTGWTNEIAVVALSPISCEKVWVRQPHTVRLSCITQDLQAECVAYGLKIHCVELGARIAGSCWAMACLCVGLTCVGSLGLGLGDGGGMVTWPAVKKL